MQPACLIMALRVHRLFALAVAAALMVAPQVIRAHPHVFVDGRVDFVMEDSAVLSKLNVTWLYDPFETLYILSANELSLTTQGQLDPEARQKLIAHERNWADDFDGVSHLALDGTPVALNRPSDFDVRLVAGRLEVTFTRSLIAPANRSGHEVELSFYEPSYFYAFSLTSQPRLVGPGPECSSHLITFKSEGQTTELQKALRNLSREETPDQRDVGALFADKVILQCA